LEKDKKVPHNKKYRWLRRILRVLLGVLIFFILLIIFIRSPWGQGVIVNKATSYVSNKTNTKVEIDRLFITFSGNVYLDGLFLEDTKGDTLLYSKSLEVDVPLWPIISGNGISVNLVDWEGLKANVTRKDTIEGFNFQFLIDAFAGENEEATFESEEREQLDLFVENIHFKDFDLKYRDEVTGMDTGLKLGSLYLKIETMDLESMIFHVANLEIDQADVHYLQNLPFPESEQSEEPAALQLIVDQFSVKNFNATYQSVPDGITAIASLGELSANIPLFNLLENNVDVTYLGLKNSDIVFNILSEELTEINESITEKEIKEFDFNWPEWKINVNKLELLNNNLKYSVNNDLPVKGKFNTDALHLNNFNLIADDIFLGEKSTGLQLNTLSFEEASGIDLNELAFALSLDENNLNLSDLNFILNETQLQGNISLSYFSLNELINQFENTAIQLDIPEFRLETKEALRFAPELRTNEPFMVLTRKPLRGNIAVSGSMSSLSITNTDVFWGQTTSVKLNGRVQNVMEPEQLQLDFPTFNFTSVRRDVLAFVNEEELGISIPETISLKSNFKGAPDDLTAQASLKIPEGDIQIKGSYYDKEELAFQADVSVIELQLGKILQNEQLGNLNLTLNAKGKGKDINSLDADVEAKIISFEINDYAIKDLVIDGEIVNGEGTVKSAYKDENLDVVFETFMQLDSVAPRFVVDLDLKGIDLMALGLTKNDIRGAFVLNADFKGNAEDFTLTSEIKNGLAVYDNRSYLLGDIKIDAMVQKDTTSLDIINKMIDLELRSNASPEDFGLALERHFNSYFSDETESVVSDSIINPVSLTVRSRINKAPILSDVFVQNLNRLDTISISVDFNEKDQQLTAGIDVPHIDYDGSIIDDLIFNLDSSNEHFIFDLGFENINAGPVAISQSIFVGNFHNQNLHLDFNSYFENEKIVQINSRISSVNDTIRLHIKPANLIINNKNWDIPAANEITYAENHISANEFKISRNSQLFEILTDHPEIEKEHLAIHFENFRLSDFLNYLNPEETLARGRLNGNIIAEDPFGSMGLIADLQIEEFSVMEVPLGNLSLEAQEANEGIYDFNLALKGGDIDLDLTGDFQADAEAARLNLDLELNEIKMSALAGFSGGEITDPTGNITGSVKVSGTTVEPQYNGDINFNDAGFRVAMLNAKFLMQNENLTVNNEGLNLSNFIIRDENGNQFTVNGKVLTETLTNPGFDLQFDAKNFRALNSTSDDNDLFYGTAVFDVDAKLTGNLNLPQLELRLNVGSETDITYILTDSELEMEERDGVVLFVNREDPDDIITQTREETFMLTGFAINSVISINENAVFNVIIDERTGDNLRIGGEGNLNFNIFPNGRTTLSGRYVMNKGHFEMNLYNLVRRRFEISPGSSVTWAGDPFDANMDIRAIYRVQAAASSLMVSSTMGATGEEMNRFRQQLPFLVYMNIDGELTRPILTFNLDMPEDSRGAIGGQVYNRVRSLNQQEEELNKQVFSLLVLNRFFPQAGSDGSGGGTMALARNNLNQALSDQLNMFSNQLLGSTGIELDFGLDSFTDYQGDGAQDRTQLDITARKRLFNDRVIVSVGSEVDIQGESQDPNESTPVIGNVSVEYLITENGRLRLKGFRRNQYENVIDGQLIVNGIALIYTREFNQFKELFARQVEEEVNNSESDNDE
jgi:translocation and assembly module TamB